jgi:hypothetical protein
MTKQRLSWHVRTWPRGGVGARMPEHREAVVCQKSIGGYLEYVQRFEGAPPPEFSCSNWLSACQPPFCLSARVGSQSDIKTKLRRFVLQAAAQGSPTLRQFAAIWLFPPSSSGSLCLPPDERRVDSALSLSRRGGEPTLEFRGYSSPMRFLTSATIASNSGSPWRIFRSGSRSIHGSE